MIASFFARPCSDKWKDYDGRVDFYRPVGPSRAFLRAGCREQPAPDSPAQTGAAAQAGGGSGGSSDGSLFQIGPGGITLNPNAALNRFRLGGRGQ